MVLLDKTRETSALNANSSQTSLPVTYGSIIQGEPHLDLDNEGKVTENGSNGDVPLSELSGRGDEERPNENTQDGVRLAEAITLTWTRTSLIFTYILFFCLYMVNAFQSSITGNLGAYVVSGFEAHSLIPVIGIVSSVMSAATYMVVAKILNLFDRSAGFVAMVCFATIGLILSATCTNIATYSAAQVFYGIGFVGMIFCIDVITADTSTLKSRGLAYAFTSSPYVITAFAGPKAAEGFHESNWRWAYGTFAIILPVVATPLLFLLQYNKLKAKKQGLYESKQHGRTFFENFKYYVIEFDVLGVFLITAGLVLFLLPFSIAGTTTDDWKSASVISMLVIGFCCLVAFVFVERYIVPVPFLPFQLLISRSVAGACALDFTYQIAYYCWNSYFTSYLQVVFGVSISKAGYIGSIFDVVNGVWLLGTGFLIRRTGYYRWLLFIAVPLYILGTGLMIYFRQPGQKLGFMIMCQIFAAFGGGTMIIVQQVSVLSASSHNDAAAVLALLGLFGYIGGACGNAISGAIWTHTLPQKLQELLPADTQELWEDIYDSLDVQLSYPMGDPTRDAIMNAYAITQKRMLIAGTCIMSLSLIWMLVIKNIKVSDIKQVKGVLF